VLHGLNLQNELPQNAINVIRQTLLERKVVFFRDQTLTREQHLAFGRRFGK
jgi:taurine dioxygenase